MKGHFVASVLNRARPKSNFEYDKNLLNADIQIVGRSLWDAVQVFSHSSKRVAGR